MNSESQAALETLIELFTLVFFGFFLFSSQDNTKLNELAHKDA